MSSQLISIVPVAPLTDAVFVFNQEHFVEIRKHHAEDLRFLASEPVRKLTNITGKVGGMATDVTSGVGHVAKGLVGGLFGAVASHSPGPVSSLIGHTEKAVLGGIDRTEHVAEHLVDPTKTVRDHIKYSNQIKDELPDAIKIVDENIHLFSTEMANRFPELYKNIGTQGVVIITGLEAYLVKVDSGLAQMIDILTRDNVQANIKTGHEKYQALRHHHGVMHNTLDRIHELLPSVIKSVEDVKGAFTTIGMDLKLVKEKINRGVTDPKQTFSENPEEVVVAYRALEEKRKTVQTFDW